MKKLTDEQVAKALGWIEKQGRTISRTTSHYWTFPGAGRGQAQKRPPAFTTSLDAIVAEIEARGLEIHMHKWPAVKKWPARWQADLEKNMERATRDTHYAPTAPLALCAALLAYLKEKP